MRELVLEQPVFDGEGRELGIKVISFLEANQFVLYAFKYYGLEDIVSFNTYPCEGENPYTFEVLYERIFNGQVKKFLLPISLDQYYDLLRKGLEISGLEVKKIRRFIKEGNLTFHLTYYKNRKEKMKNRL